MQFPPDQTAPILPRLVAPRPNGMHPMLIIVHATRGPAAQALQYQATVGWFNNPANQGGAATLVISHLGQLCRFMDDDHIPQYSAGFGAYGYPRGWSADDWGLSMELAQSDKQEPFADATIERAAMQAAEWCLIHGISPVHLGSISQVGPAPTVSGIIGHDELENGRKLGKSDPGRQFPWDDFIARVRRYMDGDEEGSMANLNEDGSQRIVSEGNFIVTYNGGVPVQRLGSTDGMYPGRMSKNFGGQWLWFRTLDDANPPNLVAPYWSDREGD